LPTSGEVKKSFGPMIPQGTFYGFRHPSGLGLSGDFDCLFQPLGETVFKVNCQLRHFITSKLNCL
jgi:hypothetical protein